MIGQDHVVHWELNRGERADIELKMDCPCAVNKLILMLGLVAVASKFGNEISLPKALGTCLIKHTDSFNSSLFFIFYYFWYFPGD